MTDMTQPHYIDREAVALDRAVVERLASLIVPTTPQGNAGAYTVLHADIRAAREALSQPMEAVAWREALEKIRDLKRRPTHHEIKSISQAEWERRSTRDMLREAREIAVQALAVIPTEGREGRE